MSDEVPLPVSRFYAVPLAGRMECPTCGYLILWSDKARSNGDGRWNGVSSRLRCPQCRTVYAVGILAWQTTPRSYGTGSTIPADQQPTIHQLAQLRQQAGGFLMRERRRRGEPVNRYIAEGCTCGDLPWRADCPVHGQTGGGGAG